MARRHGKGKPSLSSTAPSNRAILRRKRVEADARLDARSETRYEDEPGEPDTREVAEAWMRDPHYACLVDESAGVRG